jgi:hypothetical protein
MSEDIILPCSNCDTNLNFGKEDLIVFRFSLDEKKRMFVICLPCLKIAKIPEPDCYFCGKKGNGDYNFHVDFINLNHRTTTACCSLECFKKAKDEAFSIEKLKMKKKCCGCQEIKEDMLRCGGCHMKFYCSKECQKKDWVNHKPFCQSLKQ